MKKGTHHTESAKKILSEKTKKRFENTKSPFYGRHHTDKTKELLRQAHIGLHPSLETRQKMSKSQTGRKQKESTKKLLSEQRKGIPRPQHVRDALIRANKNRIISLETRQKMSIAGKGRPKTYEWKKSMSERRKGWKIPFYDTKPERMMQFALALNGIKFEKHKRIDFDDDYHHVDLFIEPNIVVEVDGVHWHTKPENRKRDLILNQTLNLRGYHVIRIRDKDILKDANRCAENILNLIKDLNFKMFS